MSYDAWKLMTPEEDAGALYCKPHDTYYSRHGDECPECMGVDDTSEDEDE